MRPAIIPAALLVGVLGLAGPAAAAEPANPPQPPASAAQTIPLFATVAGQQLTVADLDGAARETFRRKFYHAKPPEEEITKVLREVGQNLIDQVLLAREVERRKVEPDAAAIDAEVAGYEQRYAGSPQWQQQRDTALPQIREFLARKSRLARLEASVRAVPPPTKKQAEAYYRDHLELFKEPEQIRVSLILLGVHPSSPTATWEETTKQAEALVDQLRGGADFAELAKSQSTAPSAAAGGDMGYIHRGMLAEEVHVRLDKMKVGELSEPIRSLEGMLLVKLTDRKLPQQRTFAEAEARARELWQRDAAERAWQDFLVKLRAAGEVVIAPEFRDLMDGSQKATTR